MIYVRTQYVFLDTIQLLSETFFLKDKRVIKGDRIRWDSLYVEYRI